MAEILLPSAMEQLQINSSTTDEEKELIIAVDEFLAPLKESLILQVNKQNEGEGVTSSAAGSSSSRSSPRILKSLCHLIWEPDVIYTRSGVLRRFYNQLQPYFKGTEEQSDLDDFLEYKPAELLGYKVSQVVIALILPDPGLFIEEMKNFKKLMGDFRVARDARMETACVWMYRVFKEFSEYLMGGTGTGTLIQEEEEGETDKDKESSVPFEKLHVASRCIINAVSVTFIKMFKIKGKERVERMQKIVKDDESSVEWLLMLGETLRLQRRDSRNKRPSQKEMELLEKAMSIAPENPFVQLAIIDTMIGSVRDSSGRFQCGEIRINTLEDAMRYIKENCLEVTLKYPKNVGFHCIVSDYFARYFPHAYFDADRALELLDLAYQLNPSNPRITHRFSILWRMSYADCNKSLHWLTKTIDLEPTHFSATLEYFKTLLGRLNDNVASLMQMTLEDEAISGGWTELEKSEFLFYLGVAHFAKGDQNAMFMNWMKCMEVNEEIFKLQDMLTSSDHFQWDYNRIGIDIVRKCIQMKKNAMAEKMKNKEPYDTKKQHFVEKLFKIILGFKTPERMKPSGKYASSFPVNFLAMVCPASDC